MKPVPPNIRFSSAVGQLRADPVDELHGASLAARHRRTGRTRTVGVGPDPTLSATPAAPRILRRRARPGVSLRKTHRSRSSDERHHPTPRRDAGRPHCSPPADVGLGSRRPPPAEQPAAQQPQPAVRRSRSPPSSCPPAYAGATPARPSPRPNPMSPTDERTWGMLAHAVALGASVLSGGFLGFVARPGHLPDLQGPRPVRAAHSANVAQRADRCRHRRSSSAGSSRSRSSAPSSASRSSSPSASGPSSSTSSVP